MRASLYDEVTASAYAMTVRCSMRSSQPGALMPAHPAEERGSTDRRHRGAVLAPEPDDHVDQEGVEGQPDGRAGSPVDIGGREPGRRVERDDRRGRSDAAA